MLSLPIHKELKYFSYTSFKHARDCEMSFYHERLSATIFPKFDGTEQTAVGSAFDSFVKCELAGLLGRAEEPKTLLAKLLDTVGQQFFHCIEIGHDLFDRYNDAGCVQRLINEGLDEIELEYLGQIDERGVIGNQMGVPILGKPDAKLKKNHPIDWKVNGFNSQFGASPKAGYASCYEGSFDRGRHADFGKPFELIDADWATQLVFYNWLLGNTPPFYGAIEQVAISPRHTFFVSYRGQISQSFSDSILVELNEKWYRFAEGKFKEPSPCAKTCHPYNNPRWCTMVCKEYKAIMENPNIRDILQG